MTLTSVPPTCLGHIPESTASFAIGEILNAITPLSTALHLGEEFRSETNPVPYLVVLISDIGWADVIHVSLCAE